MFLMGILFITHTIKFMEYKKTSEVIIDVNTKEVNKLNINMIITMHKSPCHILSMDVVDVTGVHVVDVAGKLHKYRLDKNGNHLGVHDVMDNQADFSNAGQSMDQIYDETVKAMDEQEGCRVEGTIIINKVPGNFHLSTHAFG